MGTDKHLVLNMISLILHLECKFRAEFCMLCLANHLTYFCMRDQYFNSLIGVDLLAQQNNWKKNVEKKLSDKKKTYSHWIPATERGCKSSRAAASSRMCWRCRLCFAIVFLFTFSISQKNYSRYLTLYFTNFLLHQMKTFFYFFKLTFLHLSFKLSFQFLLWTLMVVGNYADILGLSRLKLKLNPGFKSPLFFVFKWNTSKKIDITFHFVFVSTFFERKWNRLKNEPLFCYDHLNSSDLDLSNKTDRYQLKGSRALPGLRLVRGWYRCGPAE